MPVAGRVFACFFGGCFRVFACFPGGLSCGLFPFVFLDVPAFQPFLLLAFGHGIAAAAFTWGRHIRCFLLTGLIPMMLPAFHRVTAMLPYGFRGLLCFMGGL